MKKGANGSSDSDEILIDLPRNHHKNKHSTSSMFSD
jgi:hypothetical protein